MLAEEGYGLTLSARRPEKLEEAIAPLRDDGHEVETVAANVVDEDEVKAIFTAHEERFGRLDVLVNNAGVGIGAPMAEIQTKFLDMQLGVNLRSLILGTREGLPMLRSAGAEHGKALIVNTSSLAGKAGPAVALGLRGDQGCGDQLQRIDRARGRQRRDPVHRAGPRLRRHRDGRLHPRADPAEPLIQPADIGEAVRFLLRISPNCHVPEIVFTRPGEAFGAPVAPCGSSSPPSATPATFSRRSPWDGRWRGAATR